MSLDMDTFRKIVEKDVDHKESVSFNYPKYEEMGTPYEVWELNLSKVEESLEGIIESQPWKDEYPLMYIKREEKDLDGRVIRAHLDLYGKTTMVKFAMSMLNNSVKLYVSLNTLSSDKSGDMLSNLPPKLLELLSKNPNGLLDIIPVNPEGKESIKDQIAKHLKAKGIDASKVQIINGNVPEDSLTNLSPDDVPTGPLDFGIANDIDIDDKSEGLPLFIMPNPNPDEYN